MPERLLRRLSKRGLRLKKLSVWLERLLSRPSVRGLKLKRQNAPEYKLNRRLKESARKPRKQLV